MNKRNKKIYLSILVPLAAIVLSTASIAATGLTAAIFIDTEANTFDVTVSGNKFTCYKLVGNENSNKVAIGWSRDNQLPSDTPSSLTLPVSVSDGTTTYTVAAIAPGGFRYCDFTTFTFDPANQIQDIQEEAFAYCTNLTSIQLPYGIERIAPSCFLDCRSLQKVYYSDSGGATAINNRKITEIGDHAFDSCVSLQEFTCPRLISKFGQSCFQRCTSFSTFSFSPRILGENDVITNPIEIESYAFADCSGITKMYFEENLTTVHPYAFADCNTNLVFDYTGNKTANQLDTAFGAHWRDKKINNNSNAKYNINVNQTRIIDDDLYPGLTYTIETKDEFLDCANTNTTTIKPISGGTEYAVITGFTAPPIDVYNNNPNDDIPDYDYYRTDTHTLTLPDYLGGKPVKAIKDTVFKDKFQNSSVINKIVFNSNLVQIRHHAFQNCYGITEHDFSNCTNLMEISYLAFACYHAENKGTSIPAAQANHATRINLPSCLQYLGDYAFENFMYAEEVTFGDNPSLHTIGERGFYRLGKNTSVANIDLVLPNSLNDQDTQTANLWHNFGESNRSGKTYRYTAIGRHAFDLADGLLTVTMADPTSAQRDNNSYTCSFGTSAFVRCKRLIRLTMSDNFLSFGAGALKETQDLREIFFTTKKAAASTLKYPWGCDNDLSEVFKGSIFQNSQLPNLVIYIDGDLPGDLGRTDLTSTRENPPLRWNAESNGPYPNELNAKAGSSIHSNTRSHVPTFTNVDWQNGNGVVYWKPSNNTVSADNKPTTVATFNDVVVIVKEKTTDNSDKYVVGKYYTTSTSTGDVTINMTAIPGVAESTIKTIGDGSFASESNNCGTFIVLPSGVEKIGERAFYRKADSRGVKGVSYKESGTIQAPTGKTFGTDCFCMLPSGVKRIERDAFYNNRFVTVDLGGCDLEFLGESAFLRYSNASGITSISNLSSSHGISIIGGGIYYTGVAAKKTLLYQPGGNASTALTIAAGTKAVGMRAVARSKFNGVTIPDGLTHIYGGGFQYSTELLSVTNGKDLQYISATKSTAAGDDTVEIYDDSLPFDNIDYRDSLDGRATPEARYGAFKNCTKLAEVDFVNMTDLRKIGVAAFSDCTALKKSSASKTYSYEVYTKTGDTTEAFTPVSNGTNINEGVLDLTNCTKLRMIGKQAFANCSSIKFAHLPNTTGENKNIQSKLYCSYDPDDTAHSNSDITKACFTGSSTAILIGEVPKQASPDYSGNLSASTHYANDVFATNQRYYHITASSDVIEGVDTARYWTKKDGKYILFETTTAAKHFFTMGNTPDANQF